MVKRFLSEISVQITMIREVVSYFPVGTKKTLLRALSTQIVLVIFDLLAVLLIGLLGSLAITGIQSTPNSSIVGEVLDLFNLQDLALEIQISVISGFAMAFLIMKSWLSALITRKVIRFLSMQSAEVAYSILNGIMHQPLSSITKFSTQKLIFALSTNTERTFTIILSSSMVLVADLFTLLVLLAGLLLLSPTIALSTLLIFGAVLFIVLHQTTHKIKNLAKNSTALVIRDAEFATEQVLGFREAYVGGRRSSYLSEARMIKRKLADYSSELIWMPNMSKYILEMTFALSLFAVSAIQFTIFDAPTAVAGISVFLISSSRIMPALLRIQQSITTIQASTSTLSPLREIVSQVKIVSNGDLAPEQHSFQHDGFVPSISLRNVDFSYPNDDRRVLSRLNLEIQPGQFVAVVGTSGSGKSTLIDLMLGVLIPTSGQILISGLSPEASIQKWPGAIGYVPQEVFLRKGSIENNILMGRERSRECESHLARAVRQSRVEKFVISQPDGMEFNVEERGSNMSQGQRQRIGIARALFSNPKILVLDEATSSQDRETEDSISGLVHELKGRTTVIMIAHRLELVTKADLVLFVNNGQIEASGTFQEVRAKSRRFDLLASLNGL